MSNPQTLIGARAETWCHSLQPRIPAIYSQFDQVHIAGLVPIRLWSTRLGRRKPIRPRHQRQRTFHLQESHQWTKDARGCLFSDELRYHRSQCPQNRHFYRTRQPRRPRLQLRIGEAFSQPNWNGWRPISESRSARRSLHLKFPVQRKFYRFFQSKRCESRSASHTIHP